MKKGMRLLWTGIGLVSSLIVLAVCLHSLSEIHYLKSFLPRGFAVQEVMYASVVELIKIAVIVTPFAILIAASLVMLVFSVRKPRVLPKKVR